MAVKLRLRREGTKKRPHYRIVVADSRAPRDGRFIEIIGEYHPLDNPSRIRLDGERALHWLRHGAQATSQVENLLRIEGVWEEFKPGDTRKRPERGERQRMSKKARARAEEAAAEEPAAEPAPDTSEDADAEAGGEE